MKDDKIYRLLRENDVFIVNALAHIFNFDAIRIAKYYNINLVIAGKLLRKVVHEVGAEVTIGFRDSNFDLDKIVYEKLKDSFKQHYLVRRERAIQRLNNKRFLTQ